MNWSSTPLSSKTLTLTVRIFAVCLVVVVCITMSASLRPQSPPNASAEHPMTISELFSWKNVRLPAISNDGHAVAYVIGTFTGDSEVVLHKTSGEKDQRFPIGAGGGGAKFSSDSNWLAYLSHPTQKQTTALKKQQKRLKSTLHILNVSSDVTIQFEDVKDFAFSGEKSVWLAVHKEQPEALAKDKSKDKGNGSDLVLHNLASGEEMNFGNISNYAFDKSGKWLAMTVDAQDGNGNGLVVRDMESGVVSSIDNLNAVYQRLDWAESGEALALLRGVEDKKLENKRSAVIGVTGFASGKLEKVIYDPAKDEAFPKDMTISGNRSPEWTADRQSILFGLCANVPKVTPPVPEPGGAPAAFPAVAEGAPGADEEQPNLMIWNWQDTRIPTLQKKEQQKDKDFSYLALFHVQDRKFVRLADESLREVQPPRQGRWAVGLDARPYALQAGLNGQTQEAHAQVYEDLYAVDMETGARHLVHKKVRSPWYAGESPDGTRVLFFENENYQICELANSQCHDVTSHVPTSFVDPQNDHYSVGKPPVLQPLPVWSRDSRSVIISDLYDLWVIPADGGKAFNLTVNGKKDQISYHILLLEPKLKATNGADLSQPLYLNMFGTINKKGGIARLNPGQSGAQVLQWQDAIFTDLTKAKDEEAFVYKRETHAEPPDYYLADKDLVGSKKISGLSAQQKGIAWSSGSRLIQFTSDKRDKLQAALFLPANYKEGQSYPTIVSIYERKSQELNSFFSPTFMGIFDEMLYTSHGYAVLEPDITYRVNDPGMSAVWCVLPALKAAIATGIVDSKHVGIQGHSWGGYQTAFLVTQTNAFAAAEAGAPLTDMVSMWGLVYKNTGNANSPLLESGQGRFSGPPLENMDAYIRNSPMYHAAAVKTPLLILADDLDGAVDFTQGLEYFSTLRRLRKPVVLLEYLGENHVLQKVGDQKDYTLRGLVFFDHFLKDTPAPTWWTEDISVTDLQNEIRNGAVEKNAAGADDSALSKDPQK